MLDDIRLEFAIIGGLFGLLMGSAINAMVWRLYVGRSWMRGRSECPDCGHVLAAKDLVPILSWLALRGKCRYCHKPIQDHPVVELVSLVLFAVSAAALLPASRLEEVRLSFWVIMLAMLIVLAVYDARWLILPDKVVVPLMAVGLVYSLTIAVMTHNPQALYGPVMAAALAGGGFFGLVAASRGRAMGGGDIKLAFAMGLILGVQGTIVALLVAFNVAALVGLVLIASRRRGRKDQIPFGPYLVGGTIVAFLFGRQLVEWYLRLNGLA